jgi:hypothetical protein
MGLCSRRPQLESRLIHRLSWLRVFVIILRKSRQMPWLYLNLAMTGSLLVPSTRYRDAIPGDSGGNVHILAGDNFVHYIIIYLLTQWSAVLLEKLTGLKLAKKFRSFYGTRRFLTHSQVPATCLYPEPAQSSPYPHMWSVGHCHHGMSRPQVADGGTASNIEGSWISSRGQPTRGGLPVRGLGEGLTTPHCENVFLLRNIRSIGHYMKKRCIGTCV